MEDNSLQLLPVYELSPAGQMAEVYSVMLNSMVINPVGDLELEATITISIQGAACLYFSDHSLAYG